MSELRILGHVLRWNPDAEEWQWRDGDVAIYAYTVRAVHTISVTRRGRDGFVRGLDAHGTSWPAAERSWRSIRESEGFDDV